MTNDSPLNLETASSSWIDETGAVVHGHDRVSVNPARRLRHTGKDRKVVTRAIDRLRALRAPEEKLCRACGAPSVGDVCQPCAIEAVPAPGTCPACGGTPAPNSTDGLCAPCLQSAMSEIDEATGPVGPPSNPVDLTDGSTCEKCGHPIPTDGDGSCRPCDHKATSAAERALRRWSRIMDNTPTPAPARKSRTPRATPVEVDTSAYELSHGKKPRGGSGWAFCFGPDRAATIDSCSPRVYWTPAGMGYGEARRAAIVEARRRGSDVVEVMT